MKVFTLSLKYRVLRRWPSAPLAEARGSGRFWARSYEDRQLPTQ